MPDRDVVYKIKLANDDGNAAILKRFQDLHTQTYGVLSKLAAEFAQKKVRTEEEALAKQEKAAAAAAEKERKRKEKDAADNIRLIERQAAEQERSDQKLVKSHESAGRQLAASRRQLNEGLLSTQEAVTRLGRGFALLGIVGEKDMAKLVAELAKVQALIDITSGAARLYIALSKAVDGYTKSVQAAAAAETVLGVARARSAAIGTAGPLTQGAAGVSGVAAAGGGGAAAAGGSAVATIGAVAAAVASLTAVIWELGEIATGQAGKVGSLTDRIGSAEASGAAWLHEKSGGYLFGGGQSANDRAFQGLSESNQRVGSQGRAASEESARRSREARMAELDRREAYGIEGGGDFATGDRSGDLHRQIVANAGRLGTAQAHAGNGENAALGDVAGFAEKGASLLTARLNVEREITREKMQQAREGIRGAEEELKLVDEKLSRQREALMTAKERFGQLAPEEQAKLIQIKQKADTSGFGALSREERQALRGVDTEGTKSIARAGDLASAETAGFDKVFGAEERAKIGELESQKLKVGVELNDKRALVVSLEKADAELVATVGGQVRELLQVRDAALEAKLRAEIAKLRNEVAAMSNQQVNNRGALFGN